MQKKKPIVPPGTNACQHYLATGKCNSLFDGQGFTEHHFSLVWSVSENAQDS